jgi:hypothetical protein
MGKRFAILIGVAAAGVMAFAAPASATTDTFNYTGAAQTWTVPTGVTSATFDLYGARGGGGAEEYQTTPGLGGEATATIAVTPGASIEVNVGGQGGRDTAGFNGGGASTSDGPGGGGGGGASDIRIGGTALADRMLVAGGGGGAGSLSCLSQPVAGGDGGGESGEAGGAPPQGESCGNSLAGGGGTQDTGGTGGGSSGGFGFPATPGGFGVGGNGGLGGSGSVGGGGGGGWYGGGGGYNNAGSGGGGSGHGPAGTTFQTGVRDGNGLVIVTYTVQAPTIADLIDAVQALNLSSPTENSLLKKLTGAQKNLDSGNTAGACDKLASFISQVKALKGKKIIPASAADDLIAEATAVRASVGCG